MSSWSLPEKVCVFIQFNKWDVLENVVLTLPKSLTWAEQTGAIHQFLYSPSLQPVLDKQLKNKGRLLKNMPNSGLLSTVIINPDEICGRGRVCSVLGADVKQVTGVGLQLIQSVTAFPRRTRRRRWFLCLGILTRLLMMITAETHVLWAFICSWLRCNFCPSGCHSEHPGNTEINHCRCSKTQGFVVACDLHYRVLAFNTSVLSVPI